MKSLQDVFDRVVTHLRTQGKRAYSDLFGCMYRAPDGTKCAVGCLIPDEVYNKTWEGMGVSVILQDLGTEGLGIFGMSPEDKGRLATMLSELQQAHDSVLSWNVPGSPGSMAHKLAQIATDYDLTYTAQEPF